MSAVPICFRFERHVAWRAFSRAWAKTGNRIAARMAMMAITTSNSMSVKPRFRGVLDTFTVFLRWRSLPSISQELAWPCQSLGDLQGRVHDDGGVKTGPTGFLTRG